MEAFSDGVIAVIITIMVLEMKAPHSPDLNALQPVIPAFLSYILSFVFVGIYWNNHHHLLQSAQRVSGGILWANLHLLFWLSLIPFVTAWMGDNGFAPVTVALYGVVMLCAAIAYFILTQTLIAQHGKESDLAIAMGYDIKGKASIAAYLAAVLLAFVHSGISCAIYILVAIMWLVPDRRIERVLAQRKADSGEDKE